MLVFCVSRAQGAAIFTGSSWETSILFHSHNTRQDKIVPKFVARKGRSVIPIQNRYLFPSCAPCPKICNLRTKPIVLLICFESFARLCLNQYRSLSRIVTLTMRVWLFGNLKRQERHVAETAPKCHRVMRRAGFQKATWESCYPIYVTQRTPVS
jgi:hypothetical protein